MFRLLNQRANIFALLAVLMLGSGFVGDRWIPHGLFLFAIIAMAALHLHSGTLSLYQRGSFSQ